MNPPQLFREFLRLFFPDYCAACGDALLPSEEGICLHCLSRLPKTNNFRNTDNGTEQLLAGRFPFEHAATFCVYVKEGILQSVIHQIKYNGKKELGVAMGRLFAHDLDGSNFLRTVDLIVPVPLHPKKQKQRGYNQSEMIARGLSVVSGIPVSTGNLVRTIYNPTQTKRTKTQRWENVKGIFTVIDPGAFSGRHLLLVDDVITTGSTLEACAAALGACHTMKMSIAALGGVL